MYRSLPIYKLALLYTLILFIPLTAGCICIPPFLKGADGGVPSTGCKTDQDCSANETCKNAVCTRLNAICRAPQKRACTAFSHVGLCKQGIQECIEGRWSICNPKNIGAQEECNGIDDNCNGQIDETFPNKTNFCQVPNAHGPCVQGEYACTNGAEICESIKTPTPEGDAYKNCNDQLDNDCDGKTDTDIQCKPLGPCTPGTNISCYSGKPGTKGKGSCKAGKRLCEADKTWGACIGEILPMKEVCKDGKDNDCDGLADEDCEQDCTPLTKRFCYTGPTSTKSIGICKSGISTCNLDKTWGDCIGEILPTREICNDQKDNDCNGKTDEVCTGCTLGSKRTCYSGSASTKNIGNCKEGIQLCKVDKTWGTCRGEIKPAKEVCNDKVDNDCNGKTDDCGQPAAKQLASGSWDPLAPIILWDVAKGASVKTLTSTHKDTVYSLRYSTNGKWLVSGGHDKKVALWNSFTAATIWQNIEHKDAVYSVAFEPKSSWVASGSGDKNVILWEVKSGKKLATLGPFSGAVYALDISPDGRFMVHSSGHKIRVWDLATMPPKPSQFSTLTAHNLDVYALRFHPQNRFLASGSRDKKVILWNLTTGKQIHTITHHTKGVTALAFSSDGKQMAIGGSDQKVSIWDVTGTKPVLKAQVLQKGIGAIYSLAFQPNSSLLAIGTYNNKILIWDQKQNKVIKTLQGHNGPVSALIFQP